MTTPKLISPLSLLLLALLLSCNPEAKPPGSNAAADSSASTATPIDSVAPEPVPEPAPKSFEDQFAIHDLFQNEISDVVNTIGSEDFGKALNKIKHYRETLTLTATQEAYFRFMEIYATAGSVVAGKKSKNDLRQVLKSYQNQHIISHHYEITPGGGMPFNQVQLDQETPGTIEITCANNDGFNILCFVRAKMKRETDLKANLGKRAYLCGRLSDFKLSDKDVNSWICDFDLADGFVKVLEDEY